MLRPGDSGPALLQRVRTQAGPFQPVLRRTVGVYEMLDRAACSVPLWRWRAIPRFHVRRRRGGSEFVSSVGPGRFGQNVQRRKWRKGHAETVVGDSAEARRRAQASGVGTGAPGE